MSGHGSHNQLEGATWKCGFRVRARWRFVVASDMVCSIPNEEEQHTLMLVSPIEGTTELEGLTQYGEAEVQGESEGEEEEEQQGGQYEDGGYGARGRREQRRGDVGGEEVAEGTHERR